MIADVQVDGGFNEWMGGAVAADARNHHRPMGISPAIDRAGPGQPSSRRGVEASSTLRRRLELNAFFTSVASRVAGAAGQPQTFITALVIIGVWAISGPVFAWSDTWQLIVNTGTTIVTFLMVFLIQNSQNRDAAAMQAKLDELLRALDTAREGFIGIEHLTEDQIEELRSALEHEADGQRGKPTSAHVSVEHVLRRL